MRHVTEPDHPRRAGNGARERAFVSFFALICAFAGRSPPALAGPNTCAAGVCTTDIRDLRDLAAADLVQAFVGPQVAVSNVKFTGARVAAGTVTQIDPAVYGFSVGIALSTGCLRNLPGPNSSPAITCDNALPGDADLDAITGMPSADAAALEFDFVPTGPGADLIHFRYVFASEEYNDWVGAAFNDTFAFLVNGRNITWVPGMGEVPVQIAQVNDGNPRGMNNPKNPALYRDNDVWDPTPPVPVGLDTEMDGMTVVFGAQARVTPGAVNHIKIVIGDLGDRLLDSNVILEARSFTTGCADTDRDGICDDADGAPFTPDAPPCPKAAPIVTPMADAAGISAWLWPPDHKYSTVTLADCIGSIRDACGGAVPITGHGRILRVTSDEPEDSGKGGDGHTCNDMVVALDGQSVQLRAERMGGSNGKGPGRVYRIDYLAEDGRGNRTPGSCVVAVSHDRGQRAQAIDTCEQVKPGAYCDPIAPHDGAFCVPGIGQPAVICLGYGALHAPACDY